MLTSISSSPFSSSDCACNLKKVFFYSCFFFPGELSIAIQGVKQDATHPDVGVNLLLETSNQGKVLPDGLLEVQDAAALLLGVTGDVQLETHALLLLTVFLHVQKIYKTHTESGGNTTKDSKQFIHWDLAMLQPTLRLGSTCNSRLLTMSRIIAY